MGARMAKNLALQSPKPIHLFLFDINPEVGKKLLDSLPSVPLPSSAKKISLCSSMNEIAAHASIIVTMLPNNEIVQRVYLEHLLPNIKSHSTLIDCSTISPHIAQNLAVAAAENEATFIDAPVSGGMFRYPFLLRTISYLFY
jgi:3-hydroxyisobutyrate dehydrogenase-like beta-hydroxyacid dehydrogenase